MNKVLITFSDCVMAFRWIAINCPVARKDNTPRALNYARAHASKVEKIWGLIVIKMADEESGYVQARFTTKQSR